jgi:hypothetical protein
LYLNVLRTFSRVRVVIRIFRVTPNTQDEPRAAGVHAVGCGRAEEEGRAAAGVADDAALGADEAETSRLRSHAGSRALSSPEVTTARQDRHRSAKHMARPDTWSSREELLTVCWRNHQLSTAAAGRDSVERSSARFFA